MIIMETRNTLSDLTGRGVIRLGLLVFISLAFTGCAQFQHQIPEKLPFMDRAQTKTDGKIQDTEAVLSSKESEQIFAFPLASKNILPVLLEIENNSKTTFFLYHIVLNLDIYSSEKVAWKFQSSFYSKAL